MNRLGMLVLVPAAAVAAACGRDKAPADAALSNDLALAAQAQPFNPQQFASPTELGYAYNPQTGQYQPVPRYQTPPPAPVYRTVARAPARRASSSSGTRVIYRRAPEPIRHTKRDAAIGAAAGAVIGATTSRDKLKGGLIGAAAGAVLGGIIGHTVDVERP